MTALDPSSFQGDLTKALSVRSAKFSRGDILTAAECRTITHQARQDAGKQCGDVHFADVQRI